MVSYVPAFAVLALTKFEGSASWARKEFIRSPMPSRGDDRIVLKFVWPLQWVSARHENESRNSLGMMNDAERSQSCGRRTIR